MILGAAEIDLDFNVNVTTGTDGIILGGSGGHADAAAGSKLALVTTRLSAGGNAKVVESVTTVTTPGETVDALVTEEGVAVNSHRGDLRDRLQAAGVAVVPIEQLKEMAEGRAEKRERKVPAGRLVALLEYRDGTLIDVVRAVE
jgi:citrate lyase subunit alpha/citrate CoA-transferase